MDIGNRIKQKREELGLSQEELAIKVGYKSRSSINKIETDGRGLPQSKIVAFAKALNTTPAYLMGWVESNDNKTAPELINTYPIEIKKLPVLGSVACGIPKFASEEHELYVEAGAKINADFCLIAKGDSMINARIYDGDIIFVRKQNIVDNGDIAVVVVNDDTEATLKRFNYYKDKEMVILKAENPAYPDMIFVGQELDNIHVLGKAVAFQSDIK